MTEMATTKTVSLRQLECLRAVVETRSISGAAHALRVSPGAISLALTQMEEVLGVQLTLRTRGRGVEITSAGARVYEMAHGVASGVDEIMHVAATLRGDLAGPLRLGLFTTLSPWLFPPVAEHFATAFPDVELTLEEGGSAALQAALLEGRLDAALVYENHLVAGVEGHRIAPVRLQIALAPSHPLAQLDVVPLAALREEQAILLAIRPASDHVEQILSDAGMTPRVKWRSANVETIRSLVARGLGYTIIMGRPHGDHTYEGLPIVYRPIADALPENAVVVAVARGARTTAKVRELIAFCARDSARAVLGGSGAPTSREGRLS